MTTYLKSTLNFDLGAKIDFVTQGTLGGDRVEIRDFLLGKLKSILKTLIFFYNLVIKIILFCR